jgi:hypothetical protein
LHALHDQREWQLPSQSVLDLNIGVRTRVRQSDATGVTVPTERVDGRGRFEMVVIPVLETWCVDPEIVNGRNVEIISRSRKQPVIVALDIIVTQPITVYWLVVLPVVRP